MNDSKRTRDYMARPLLGFVVLLELGHLATILFAPHPVLASNIFQLILPVFAFCVTLHQRTFVGDAVARRCWGAVAAAFGIWATAQAIFIYSIYLPVGTIAGISYDNVLWVIFGLPLLLAINTTYDDWDRVRWLDRAQELAFFVVLYVLVFQRLDRVSQNTAYIIQNLALLLCCILRVPTCTVTRERRFFVRLTIFLFLYGTLQTVGDVLYLHGWPSGSAADLVWTVPIACYIALTLRDARMSVERETRHSRLAWAFQRARGLSVAALSFLSIGAAAYLATRHLFVGSVAMAICFVLFAIRTNLREGAWQEAHGRLEGVVLQDTLTGLGNRIQLRTSLLERLKEFSATQTDLMLFLDLDEFKSVNDSFGHSVGDRVLIEAASRLRASSPQDAVVCRLGGDEFVVLASVADANDAEAAGQRVLEAIREPYTLGEHLLHCSASIGVVLITPGATIEDLLRTADHAMYRAKQLGKNRVQLFDAPAMEQMSSRWHLEADLRGSIGREEVEVAYQPILDIQNSVITGLEALARWNHPVRGPISPAEFIPLAEETGLIPQLGAQVLEKASRQVAAWNREWKTRLTVSVNVSPRQFADQNFLKSLLATLQRTGLEPSLLKLEITESLLLVRESTVKHVLNEARAHGIRISLDDFGTGYSSLSFLLSLPVDEIKIDRSFVSDMHRNAERWEVVRTVVQLGRSLRKRVVAEGAETEDELAELAAMGCDCAQGYLISRPLGPGELEADMPSIIARNNRKAPGEMMSLVHSSSRHPASGVLQFPDDSLESIASRTA